MATVNWQEVDWLRAGAAAAETRLDPGNNPEDAPPELSSAEAQQELVWWREQHVNWSLATNAERASALRALRQGYAARWLELKAGR